MTQHALIIGGRSFPLEPDVDVTALEADILHAARVDGAFVSVRAADGNQLRCLVTSATPVVLEEITVLVVGDDTGEGRSFTSRHLRRV